MFNLFIIPFILLLIFFIFSKMDKWDKNTSSSFECGFFSFFYSRFSFSIHYFLIGLIFLFLDLELCVLIPFMMTNHYSLMSINLFLFIILMVIGGLLKEWMEFKLTWFK